jgi:hypothetical protein
MNNLYRNSADEVLAIDGQIWQNPTISGILRDNRILGQGWWYRLQAAGEIVASRL